MGSDTQKALKQYLASEGILILVSFTSAYISRAFDYRYRMETKTWWLDGGPAEPFIPRDEKHRAKGGPALPGDGASRPSISSAAGAAVKVEPPGMLLDTLAARLLRCPALLAALSGAALPQPPSDKPGATEGAAVATEEPSGAEGVAKPPGPVAFGSSGAVPPGVAAELFTNLLPALISAADGVSPPPSGVVLSGEPRGPEGSAESSRPVLLDLPAALALAITASRGGCDESAASRVCALVDLAHFVAILITQGEAAAAALAVHWASLVGMHLFLAAVVRFLSLQCIRPTYLC